MSYTPFSYINVKKLKLGTKKLLNSSLIGEYKSVFRGNGLTFASLRPYEMGDDASAIDWKASLRSSNNQIYVKEYEEERSLNIILLIDVSKSMLCGIPCDLRTTSIQFATLISLLSEKHGDSLGICLFSDNVKQFYPPKRKPSIYTQTIYRLISYNDYVTPYGNLQTALKFLQSRLKFRTIIFIISNFLGIKEILEYNNLPLNSFNNPLLPLSLTIKTLSMKHDLIFSHIQYDSNTRLPKAGFIEFENMLPQPKQFWLPYTSSSIIDSASLTERQSVDLLFSKHAKNLDKFCSSLKIDIMHLKDDLIIPFKNLILKRAKTL